MGKWEELKNKVFKRPDDLGKQIHNGKLFIESRLSDVYRDIDNTESKESKETRRGYIDSYVKEANLEKDADEDVLFHRFILRGDLNRIDYNKLKEASNYSLSTILSIDHLQAILQKAFDKTFENVYINSSNLNDIDLLGISEIMTTCKTFIEIFDKRFNEELKKK